MSARVPSNDSQGRPSSIDYQVLTELHDIGAIASSWDRLLVRSCCNRALSCSQWYLATPSLVPEYEPVVFTAWRDHVLAGILPLWLNGEGDAGFPDDFSDQLDIIAADGDLDIFAGLLCCAIKGIGRYHRLMLSNIRADSNCVQGAQILGFGEIIKTSFGPDRSLTYAVLDLEPGYDSYRRRLSHNFRHALSRGWNKLHRNGIVVNELKPDSLEPARLPEVFLTLHFSRFGQSSDFQSECPTDLWMNRLFPILFAERRMRVFAMLDGARILGIHLAMVGKRGLYGWNCGFLPEASKLSPGRLLIDYVVRQSCLEGLKEYDFGWFGQPYKHNWRPSTRAVGELAFLAGWDLAEQLQRN
ncbi:MAG TPA: GNAT family N-acetyltransferase [Candidatus Angelobacter sp.]